jgi:hypothetical protein
MELLSRALTVVVQNSVRVARIGSATTSQQLIRQVGAALGVSGFVLAATAGAFRVGLLLMIAVSAGGERSRHRGRQRPRDRLHTSRLAA